MYRPLRVERGNGDRGLLNSPEGPLRVNWESAWQREGPIEKDLCVNAVVSPFTCTSPMCPASIRQVGTEAPPCTAGLHTNWHTK